MGKLQFLSRVTVAYLGGQDKNCPHCGGARTLNLGRRKALLELRQCPACRLMFRWPKDSAEFTRTFYQRAYREPSVTDLPSPERVGLLKASLFAGTDFDFAHKIGLLKSIVPGGRVLDFGANWGYATYQLREAGFDAVGYEISQPRAAFGRANLAVEIIDESAALDRHAGGFDAIFTSHVLEHFPSLAGVFERFHRLLKPTGSALIFVPNAGGSNARRYGANWGPMICEKHPLALTRDFFAPALAGAGFGRTVFDSDPYGDETLDLLAGRRAESATLDGDELMVYARKGA
jgi:SAM-dependent methyltransferase